MRLILKGDVVAAKELDSDSSGESSDEEDNVGSKCDDTNHLKQHKWTSFEFTEAMSVFKDFMKYKPKQCKECKGKNPRITKPTFGWLHLVHLFALLVLKNLCGIH